MLSTKNLLKPADGQPIVGPSKDMVLGNYYLTMDPTADLITKKKRAEEFRHEDDIRGKNLKVGVAFNTSGQRWVEYHRLYEGNQVTIALLLADPF